MNEPVRLVKFLSAAGIASRRAAGDFIKAGRVRLNDQVVTDPGERVTPDSDQIEFDGQIIRFSPPEKHYIMLNKPAGFVCTNSDVHAEKKAIDLITPLPSDIRLFSAGRLDKESEGLIIFSNDGDYVNTLTHPRNRILKTYLVETARSLSESDLEQIRGGILDDGETLRVHSITPDGPKRCVILLNEGKKREIRRLTAAVGAPTRRLIRIQIGKLELRSLPPGKWRELSPAEVELSLFPAP